VIIGPTGVGKTRLAEHLGQHFPCEIINGDLGQLYAPLTIGTAKPDWRNSTIPQHLFDVFDSPQRYCAPEYRTRVENLIPEIKVRGRIPIIVGGSTLYIWSLFFQQKKTEGDHEAALTFVDSLNPSSYWEHLHEIDPKRAQKIHPHDTYRLRRALLQWYGQARKPSSLAPVFNPIDRMVIIHLNKQRSALKEDYATRICGMLESGWFDEVAALQGTDWEDFWRDRKIIGYEDIAAYLKGVIKTSESLLESITQKTVNYAKKQATFWRMLIRKIREESHKDPMVFGICNLENPGDHPESVRLITYFYLDLTFLPSDLYINQLSEYIKILRRI
jgi:tRNA dimethylallyltransferase